MSIEAGTLIYQVQADMAGIRKQLDGLEQHIRGSAQATTGLNQGMNHLLSLAKGFIAVNLVNKFAELAASAYKTAAAWEQDAQAFEVMLGSAKDAKILLAQLAEFGRTTPLELSDLKTNAKLMLNFGIAAQDILPNLKMLGDISGGNAQKLGQLTLAFSQMSSSGRLMGQDLLQMINAGFNPLEQISRTTGKSMGQLKKDMEEGRITTDMVQKAFKDVTSEGGRFFQMLEKQGKTAAGMMSNVNDIMTQAKVTMGNQLLPVMKLYLQDVIDSDSAIQRMALGIGEIAGKAILSFRIAGAAIENWTSKIDSALWKMMFRLSEIQMKVGKALGDSGMYRAGLEAANEYGNRWVKSNLSIIESQKSLDKSMEVWHKLGAQKEEKYLDQRITATEKADATMLDDTKNTKKEEELTLFESVQATLGAASQITGTLGNIFSMDAANRTQRVENEKTQALEMIATIYDAEKAHIEATVADKKERDAQLKALDEKRAREEKNVTEKLDKDKRKIAREAAKRNKAIATAETIISTANAAMGAASALAKIPYAGPFLAAAAAAAMAALGATQIALIQSQPLPEAAEGIYAESPYIGGEAGPELAFPLESDRGKRAMSLMAEQLLAAIEEKISTGQSKSSATIAPASSEATYHRVAPLDIQYTLDEIMRASQDGRLLIAERAVRKM